jgi:MFS family permease
LGLSALSLELEPRRGLFAPRAEEGSNSAGATTSASARALDWFAFFLSDVQTGFGPFVAIYLTAQHWAQFDIGLVLTTGGLVALAAQMPGGVLVDAVRSAKVLGAVAVVAICASALALALSPTFPVVMASRVVHAAASCVMGPILVAVSLGVAGHAGLGERLGRNARFASIGNGVAAAVMGACGYLVSNRGVFVLTALLVAPALIALARIRSRDVVQSQPRASAPADDGSKLGLLRVITDRRLLIFAACILLFQLANAAMLPLMGGLLTVRAGDWAAGVIGACIVVPQLVVVLIAPWVGRATNEWGRRRLLGLCFTALMLRAVLFGLTDAPALVVAVQALDGISAAVLGVVLPLVVADIMGGSGRFNLALGIVGSAVGIGAAMSTSIAGFIMDQFGSQFTFLVLAAIAGCGLTVISLLLPETRPDHALARSMPE